MLQIDARGLVAQANAEIRAAEAAHQWRKAERQRLRRPIALIDGLINDLELLNLRGGTRVPLAYEPRLLQLRAMLADNVSAEQLIQGGVLIDHVNGHLKNIQAAG